MNNKKLIFNKIIFNPKTLTFLGLIIIVLISYPLSINISKRYKVNKEIKKLESEIASIENKNSDLKNIIKYLESDQYIDKQARLNLNYKKEGESVAVIKNKDEQDNKISASEEKNNLYTIKESKNENNILGIFDNPTRWFKYFLN